MTRASRHQLEIAAFLLLLFAVAVVAMLVVRYQQSSEDAMCLVTGQLSESDRRACDRFKAKAGLDRRKEGKRVVQIFSRCTPAWTKHCTNAVAFSEVDVVKLIGEPEQRGAVAEPSYTLYVTSRRESGMDAVVFYYMKGLLANCVESQVEVKPRLVGRTWPGNEDRPYDQRHSSENHDASGVTSRIRANQFRNE